MMVHTGRCHCGAVEIRVNAPSEIDAYECNCSMCERTGFLHLIVPKAALEVVKGEDVLTEYTFNTKVAKHYFCKVCGCRPFYVPRSNPDGYSVNVRCLDKATIERLTIHPFDGQNWESNAASLSHLSADEGHRATKI
jgi:hypothetical protein